MTELLPVELPYKVSAGILPLDVERFVQIFVIGGNASAAFREAFGESRSRNPSVAARSLLARPQVKARLREHQTAISAMSVKDTETLVRELEELVEADVNELITVRTGSCRHCWGVGGFYQWKSTAELQDEVEKAIARGKPAPEMSGGFDYRFSREPNAECKECEGRGIQKIWLNDTDTLSPGARRLYKGVECHPDGSVKKLLLHDQLVARQELHRVRGMHIDRSMSVNLSATLPNAKEIASSPEKAVDFLESLGK